MATRKLKLDQIRIDGDTQPRASIDEDAVADYASAMERGDDFPPATVFHDGSDYWLAGGYHRFMACRRIGAKTIECQIFPGTREDASWFGLGDNRTNGLRYTRSDVERAIRRALALKPDQSDSAIGKHVGCSHSTVARYRATCQVGKSDERTDANGRKIRIGKIGTRRADEAQQDEPDDEPDLTDEAPEVGGSEAGWHFGDDPTEPDRPEPAEGEPTGDPLVSLGTQIDAWKKDLRQIADQIRGRLGFEKNHEGAWTSGGSTVHRYTYLGVVAPLLAVCRDLENGRPVGIDAKGQIITKHDAKKEATK